MLEADVMSAKRFALFEPTSPLNRLRACTRASDKLRGYFHWLAARKASEQEVATSGAPAATSGRNGKPVYRVFRAGKPEHSLPADFSVTLVADKDGQRRLTIDVRLKRSTDCPAQEVSCRVYLLEKPILERLARCAQERTAEEVPDAASASAAAAQQHRGAVHMIAVVSAQCIASGGEDGQVRLWDLETGSTHTVARHRGRVRALATTPDGRIVSGGEDGCVQMWDNAARTVRTIAHHGGFVGAIAVLPDQSIVSGGQDGIVQRWDPRTGVATTLTQESAWVESLCPLRRAGPAAGFQSDTRLAAFLFAPPAASASTDVAIGCWDGSIGVAPAAGGTTRSVIHHRQAVTHLKPYPDGWFVSAGEDGAVKLTDPVSGSTQTVLEHTGPVLDMLVPNTDVISAGEDGRVQYGEPDIDEARVITSHPGEATALALLPDGSIASGGGTGTIRLWDSRTNLVRQVAHHDVRISALAALPDGRIVAGDKNGVVRLMDPDATEPNVVGHTDVVVALTALADGRIASADRLGCVQVWNPDDDTLVTLRVKGERIIGLASLGDGSLLASTTGGTLIIWTAGAGEGHAVEKRSTPLLCLTASGGDTLVFAEVAQRTGDEYSASGPCRLCLWRAGVGVYCTLDVGREIRSVAGLSGGRVLYSDSADMVHLWDPQTGAVETVAWQQPGKIAAALPDGRVLWDSGEALQLWTPAEGQRQLLAEVPRGTALAVLPDGRVATGDRDGVVRILTVPALAPRGPQTAFLPAIFRDDFLATNLEAIRLLSAAPEVEGVIDGRGRARLAKTLVPGGEPAVTASDLCERVFFAVVLDE
jgi:WD40 repeat protein